MQVISEKTLDLFRAAGACDWCKRFVQRREPHHLYRRGMGGGGRLDVQRNLAGLCQRCHHDLHLGLITRADMLAVVAAREKCTQQDIKSEIARLRRS